MPGSETESVLVPLDGSALAGRALHYAGALARATGGRLALVTAALPSGETAEQVQAELELVADRLRASGLPVEAHVYCTPADEAILAASRQEHADLVVMFTHGRGGLGRWLFGSVADAVLRQADVPILVVPAACERGWPAARPPRILVALDGSPEAEEVLGPIGDVAPALDAEVHLLRVVAPPPVPVQPGIYAPIFDAVAELAAARRYLAETAAQGWAAGRSLLTHTDIGPATLVLTDYASEQEITLIAMATHGRGGLARLVLGSVATGVLQRAGTPVLLVCPAHLRQPSTAPSTITLI